jgi:hypothetical protein
MAAARISATSAMRVAMLAMIAVICLGSAIGWADPDLWIPFVCIIAVMGVGTRGGVLDALPFVMIEAVVVVVLGVATFSGSRDFIWAASVAVSLVAVGKIAVLELTKERDDEEPAPAPAKTEIAPVEKVVPAPTPPPAREATGVRAEKP